MVGAVGQELGKAVLVQNDMAIQDRPDERSLLPATQNRWDEYRYRFQSKTTQRFPAGSLVAVC
jgi:hypothetical protein